LQDREPVKGPWQQAAVTKFLEKFRETNTEQENEPKHENSSETRKEADIIETDGLCACIPLISKFFIFLFFI
jgi:hypothetical protein